MRNIICTYHSLPASYYNYKIKYYISYNYFYYICNECSWDAQFPMMSCACLVLNEISNRFSILFPFIYHITSHLISLNTIHSTLYSHIILLLHFYFKMCVADVSWRMMWWWWWLRVWKLEGKNEEKRYLLMSNNNNKEIFSRSLQNSGSWT